MLQWHKPGVPYEVVIGQRTVQIKAVTIAERRSFMDKVQNMANEENSIEQLYQVIVPQIVGIEGCEGDIKEYLSYQTPQVILALWSCILKGSALSEDEIKNLSSSSAPSISASAGIVPAAARENVSTAATE